MISSRLAALFALAFVFVSPVSAAWIQRYDPFAKSAPAGIAALPNGELVLAASGNTTGFDGSTNEFVIAIVGADGAVKTARKAERQVQTIAAGPRGEIFVGDQSSGESNAIVSTIYKLRRDLSVEWVRTVAVDGEPVRIVRVFPSADGGVVVHCEQYSTTTLVKLSSAGAVEWARRMDAASNEGFRSIRETRDGGFIAAGFSYARAWLVRLGADGTVLWERHYGDRAAGFSLAVETSRGTFLVLGAQGGKGTLLETDADGTPLWSKITKTASSVDAAEPIAGGFAMSLLSESERTLLVASESGEVRWQRAIPQDAMYGPHLLAVNGSEINFAAPLDRTEMHTVVLRIDAGGGVPACVLWSQSSIAFEPFAIRVNDPFPIDSFAAEATSNGASLRLEPFELASRPENCDSVRREERLPPANARTSDFKPNAEKPEFDARVKELFLAKRFAELEALAAEWRTKRSPDPLRPQRELRWLYSVMQEDTTAPARERIALLREWVAQDPSSVTARIALGSVLYEAGADLRGSGFGYSMTEAAADARAGMWKESAAIFESIGSAGENDSEYWVMLIHLTAQSGGDVKAVTLRALGAIPSPIVAMNAARYFHPEWGGSPEEFVAFMDAAARATQATHGDAVYAALQWEIEGKTGPAWPDDYKVDWNRVWRGCDALIAMSPEWLPTYHKCAREASKKQNDEYAARLFERPQLDWYDGALEIWLTRGTYDTRRGHALHWKTAHSAPRAAAPAPQLSPEPQAPPRPAGPPALAFVSQPVEKWPRFLVAGEITAEGRTTMVPFFFVSTGRSVIAISSMTPLYRENDERERDVILQSIERWRVVDSAKLIQSRHKPVSAYQPSMSFALDPKSKLPAETLTRVPKQPPMSGEVYVVACRWNGKQCEQVVLRGERVGGGAGIPPEPLRTLDIGFKERVDERTLLGAAVLDAQGYVIGVVRRAGSLESPEWASTASADDITYFVE